MKVDIIEKVVSGSRSLEKQNTFSSERDLGLEVQVAGSTTDKLVNWSCDVSQVQAIYIVSDQDLTFETNDGSSPDDTISLLANVPYIWHVNSYHAFKLTTDVTKLYLSNAGSSTATLRIEGVEDATP